MSLFPKFDFDTPQAAIPAIPAIGRAKDSENSNNSSPPSVALFEALAMACQGLPISPAKVQDALAPDDVEDWHNGELGADALVAFARSLVQRREMEQGRVPEHYTERATCKYCGPVWLWFADEVLACPWCWNRLAGRPIPRPRPVRCVDCMHFERTDHRNLGHCAQGQQESITGLWDTDPRSCSRWQPANEQQRD